jgi:uncharacterized protein (DUF433 family)
MAILTNLDALRDTALDEMIRRVHRDKEDFVIEDQTMPVAAVIDINKYQLLNEILEKNQGAVITSSGEPKVRGSDITIREVAQWHLQGNSIDDLRHHFPQLNQAQLYGALAYYYEHADEVDRLIAQRRAERAAAKPGASVTAAPTQDRREV